MFDKVIMNPAYLRSLHLKTLSTVINNCPTAEIVNLSPIRWLQDPLAEYKKSSDWKKFKDIRNRISSLDVIECRYANELFSIINSTDLGIYYITEKGGFDYKSLFNMIVDKVVKSGCTFESFDDNMKDGWRVRISTISGGKSNGSGKRKVGIRSQKLIAFENGMKDGKPWYEFYNKNKYSKTTPEITHSLKFGSEAEAENFISVMSSSKLGRYYYHNIMQNVNVLPCFFIKLNYTHPWTDKDLYEYFNLTDDEIEVIECSIK